MTLSFIFTISSWKMRKIVLMCRLRRRCPFIILIVFLFFTIFFVSFLHSRNLLVVSFLIGKVYGTAGWGHLKLVTFWESDPLHGELVVPHDELVHLLVRPFLLLPHVPKPEQPIPFRTVGHSQIVVDSDFFPLRNVIQAFQSSDQAKSWMLN